MPKITVLYGEMGAGKNYQGERLAERLGVPFLDGDDAMPPEMAEMVRSFKVVSPSVLNDFIHRCLLGAILDATRNGNDLVVAQALYRRDNRNRLREQLALHTGVEPEFIHVKVSFAQHMRQLWSRPKGSLWIFYGLVNKPFFQE